jgi:hypothetical protein
MAVNGQRLPLSLSYLLRRLSLSMDKEGEKKQRTTVSADKDHERISQRVAVSRCTLAPWGQ